MYKFIHSVLTLLLVTLLAGCATEPEKTQIPAAHAPETTSIPEAIDIIPVGSNSEEVTLEVLLSEGNTIQQGRSKNRYLGGYNDIDNISIDVKNATSGSTLQSVYLSQVGGSWTGKVYNINIGQVYQFDGKAYDNKSLMIFSGTTQQSLDNGTNTLNLRMDPVADQTVLAIPRITRIMAPSSIGTEMTDSVQVEVEGSSGSKLNYSFAAPEGGSFNPAVGSVNLLGTSATLTSNYTAPISAGIRKNTVQVTNSQGIGVKSSFSIAVSTVSNPNIAGIQFSPVVTSLVGWRDNESNTILWTADVSDDKPLDQIRYQWSFQPDNNNLCSYYSAAFDTNTGVFLNRWDQATKTSATVATLVAPVNTANSIADNDSSTATSPLANYSIVTGLVRTVTIAGGTQVSAPTIEGPPGCVDKGINFDNVTVNPATMVNYDPALSGTLKVTVTDDNGTGSSTQITYQVKQGQFPKGLVVDKQIVGTFTLVTSLVGDNNSTVSSIDHLRGGDQIDNHTGVLKKSGNLFFSSGNNLWIFDNSTSAYQLAATYDNGSGNVTAIRFDNLQYNISQGLSVPLDNGSNDRVFFQARVYDNATNASYGYEPLVADRTGVRLLGDLYPGSNGSSLYNLTQSGNKVFFTASAYNSYRNQWQNGLYQVKLDGSDNATFDNNTAWYPSNLQDITLSGEPDNGSRLLFTSQYDQYGNYSCCGNNQKIYVTDGDNTTTELNNVPYTVASQSHRVDNTIYFTQNSEIWQLPLSTVRLLQPGQSNDNGTVVDNATWTGNPSRIASVGASGNNVTLQGAMKANGKLYFRIYNSSMNSNERYQWWKSDGTSSGTTKILAGYQMDAANLYEQNGHLLYTKNNYTGCCGSSYDPNQLWSTRSTGSDNQTTLLATIGLGNRYSYHSDAPKITFVAQLPNGKWLFTANDGTHGKELWVTNGTAAGTLMLRDIYAGNSSGIATNFEYKVIGNLLYFAANDGINGEELWVTNGTAAATLKAKDFRTGSGGSNLKLFSINGKLHLFANDGSGVKIWKKNN